MKFIVFLVIFAVAFYSCQVWYFGGKVTKASAAALADLPDNPKGGYARMEPAFKRSSFQTAGKSGRARREFFDALRDSMIERLENPPMEAWWFDALEAGLEVLDEASNEHGMQLRDHQTAILEAARNATPRLNQSLGLAAWDAFVARIASVHQRGVIPAEPFVGFGQWMAELRAVDRYAIGIREATQRSAAALAEGGRLLGRGAPTAGGAGSRLAPLNPPLDDDSLLAAERAYGSAIQACQGFMRVFGLQAIPESLLLPYGKLTYNSVALKTAHLIELGPKAYTESSGYITGLLMRPGQAATPTEGELYQAFIQGTQGMINETTTYFDSLAQPRRGEPLLMRALIYRVQAQFAGATRNPSAASLATGQYRSLRQLSRGDPSIDRDLAQVESVQSVWIALR